MEMKTITVNEDGIPAIIRLGKSVRDDQLGFGSITIGVDDQDKPTEEKSKMKFKIEFTLFPTKSGKGRLVYSQYKHPTKTVEVNGNTYPEYIQTAGPFTGNTFKFMHKIITELYEKEFAGTSSKEVDNSDDDWS